MHLITVAQAMILASSTRSEWNSIFQECCRNCFLRNPSSGFFFSQRSMLSHSLYSTPSDSTASPSSTCKVFIACSDSRPVQQYLGVTLHIRTSRDKRDVRFWNSNSPFNVPSAPFSPTSIVRLSPREMRSQIVKESRYIPKCNHTSICKPDSAQSILFQMFLCVIHSPPLQPGLRGKHSTSPSQRAAGSPVTGHD